jgi:hypothetical protein
MGSRDMTSSYKQLDVRKWQRGGYLERGRFFSWQWSSNGEPMGFIHVQTQPDRATLSYRHRRAGVEEWTSEEYPVSIVWTPCNYGGHRAWFLCPARGCGRRVAILYLGGIAACRHCYQLAYDSQHEPPHGRALNRTQAIRMKLGGSGSMADPFPWKPKRMHWKTYWKLRREAEEADFRSYPPWLRKHLGVN